jgi:Na+-transporting methylmalonyl-CoA/oxaloacetate decarboxylase gamma subunit
MSAPQDLLHELEADLLRGWSAVDQADGLLLMLVGMSVVFTALISMFFLIRGLKRFEDHTQRSARRRERSAAAARAAAEAAAAAGAADGLRVENADAPGEDVPGVVVAAIALTLILEAEQGHDEESMVLTLRALPRPYSNWWQNRINVASWPTRINPGRPVTDPGRRA